MNRNRKSVLGAALLILVLLVAPAALAVSGPDCFVVATPVGTTGCCGNAPDESTGTDCCSHDFSGCPLPCCSGLTCTAAGPALRQEAGEAVPTRFVTEQERVPFVMPSPIEHPPRA